MSNKIWGIWISAACAALLAGCGGGGGDGTATNSAGSNSNNGTGGVSNGGTTPITLTMPRRLTIADGNAVIGLKADGTPVQWGYGDITSGIDYVGTPIDGTYMARSIPIKAASVTAGTSDGVFALTSSGDIYAWGSKRFGWSGGNIQTDVNNFGPRTVNFGAGKAVQVVKDLAFDSIFLMADGTVWRLPGSVSESGDVSAKKIDGISGVSSITETNFSMATATGELLLVMQDGTVTRVENISQATPTITKVTNLSNIKEIWCDDTCLALKKDGTVVGWGKNTQGTIGNGSTADINIRVSPPANLGINNIKQVYGSGTVSLAVTNNGEIWIWGDINYLGLSNYSPANQPSINGIQSTPIKMPNMTNIVEATCNSYTGEFCIALKKDGTVWGWGSYNPVSLGVATPPNFQPYQFIHTPVQAVGINLN